MAELKDSGARREFGRLTIIKELEKRNSGHVMLLCKCRCGNETAVARSAIKNGSTKSCGCFRKEVTRKNNTTHNKTSTRLYSIWTDMKKRCNNPKNKRYKNYGGRGIKVCKEWHDDFDPFYRWSMKNTYSKNLTIDRKNVDGDYEPDNCRWIPAGEQQRNTTRNHFITAFGETKTMVEWSEKSGIPYDVIKDRLNKLNWKPEDALTTKVRRCQR